jgi:hypothetical protein
VREMLKCFYEVVKCADVDGSDEQAWPFLAAVLLALWAAPHLAAWAVLYALGYSPAFCALSLAAELGVWWASVSWAELSAPDAYRVKRTRALRTAMWDMTFGGLGRLAGKVAEAAVALAPFVLVVGTTTGLSWAAFSLFGVGVFGIGPGFWVGVACWLVPPVRELLPDVIRKPFRNLPLDQEINEEQNP